MKLFTSFLAHLLVATLGAIIGGSVLAFLLALPFAFFSSGPGNIVDRAGDTLIARYSLNEPYFALPVLMAACLGFLSPRWSRSSVSKWVWLIPTIALAYNILPGLFRSPNARKWVWDNYFSAGCGSTECLYEFFITVPFYTSLSYTIGSATGQRVYAERGAQRTTEETR